MRSRRETEGVNRHLLSIVCPFCDHRTKTSATLIKCANCREAFEVDPDQEEEPYESADFF